MKSLITTLVIFAVMTVGAGCWKAGNPAADPFREYYEEYPNINYRAYLQGAKQVVPTQLMGEQYQKAKSCVPEYQSDLQEIRWYAADKIIMLSPVQGRFWQGVEGAAMAYRGTGRVQRIVIDRLFLDDPVVLLHELLHIMTKQGDSKEFDEFVMQCHTGMAKVVDAPGLNPGDQ